MFKRICILTALAVVSTNYSFAQEKVGNKVDYLTEGKKKLEQGNHNEDAIIDFDKAIQKDPSNGELYYYLGLAKQRGGGCPWKENGRWVFHTSHNKDINNRGTSDDDYKKAIELLSAETSNSAKSENAYFYMGLSEEGILNEGDRHEKAIDDFSKVIELNPKNAEAYYHRGYNKYFGDRSTEEATVATMSSVIPDLDKAIELNPKYAEAYDRRYIAKDRLGDHKGALADISKYIELKPNDWQAYEYRAILKELGLEDYEGAIADFEKAKELAPDEIGLELDLAKMPPPGKPFPKTEFTIKEEIQRDIDELKAKLAGKDNKK